MVKHTRRFTKRPLGVHIRVLKVLCIVHMRYYWPMAKASEIQILPFEAEQALIELGSLLSRARRARGDTQAVAAERCGLHAQTVARIEKGDASVSVGKLFSLMTMYDLAPRLIELSRPDETTELLARQRLPKRVRAAGGAR